MQNAGAELGRIVSARFITAMALRMTVMQCVERGIIDASRVTQLPEVFHMDVQPFVIYDDTQHATLGNIDSWFRYDGEPLVTRVEDDRFYELWAENAGRMTLRMLAEAIQQANQEGEEPNESQSASA